MKKAIKIFTIAMLMAAPVFLFAQNPPHPNGGNAPGSGTNTPVGGGAPIDGGIGILITLGAAYGLKKVRQFREQD